MVIFENHKETNSNIDSVFNVIPKLITYTCLLFYSNPEYFDVAGELSKIHDDKKTITHILESDWSVCYGVLKIPSKSNCIYRWKFKILSDVYSYSISIGIVNAKTTLTHSVANKNSIISYFYFSDGDFKHCENRNKYGIIYKDNDIIEMILDCSIGRIGNATLRYKVNDVDQGIAFDNIKQNKSLSYKMAVDIYQGCSVKLLQFTRDPK